MSKKEEREIIPIYLNGFESGLNVHTSCSGGSETMGAWSNDMYTVAMTYRTYSAARRRTCREKMGESDSERKNLDLKS